MTNYKKKLFSTPVLIGGTILATAAAFAVSSSLQERSTSSATAAATGSSPETLASAVGVPPHRGFWPTLQIVADEAEGYSSLAEMAGGADHVVVGRMSNFRLNRRIQGDAREDVVHMVAVDIDVEQVVRGVDPGKRVVLEFLLPGRPDQVAAKVQQQAASIPQAPMLFFLRQKGAGLYRIVNSLGLWLADAGSVHAPLSLALHEHEVARAQHRHSDEEAARELAARPISMRAPARSSDESATAEPIREEEHGDRAEPDVPYAAELARVHSLEDLVELVAR